jgi:hypothetical protein
MYTLVNYRLQPMSLDVFFYCAPCRLKVLLAPLGEVRASYFTQCVQLLRETGTIISFEDLDHERLSKAMFSPSSFPQGQLMFEYVTDWETHYKYLEDFQQWRKLFAVSVSGFLTSTKANRSSQSKMEECFQMRPTSSGLRF